SGTVSVVSGLTISFDPFPSGQVDERWALPILFADTNGDHRADIVWYKQINGSLSFGAGVPLPFGNAFFNTTLSNGGGAFSDTGPATGDTTFCNPCPVPLSESRFRFMDQDGDGNADILIESKSGFVGYNGLYLGSNGAFSQKVATNLVVGSDGHIQGDFNGDGK